MSKEEFEKLIGKEIGKEDYDIIETVYTWHPSIPEVGGKEVIAKLYEVGGMEVMKDMHVKAIKYYGYAQLKALINKIKNKIDEIEDESVSCDCVDSVKADLKGIETTLIAIEGNIYNYRTHMMQEPVICPFKECE